ncbi:MAG TPA: prolyl oligopeptidase family serine peptidase, partial [Planctomycetota bacterium]|nr:prolyl oligopeptidase family serine peptidase [Planctomycetota bacterium]
RADVEIYHKAVRWALQYNEIYDLKEIPVARQLLKEGLDRVKALRNGRSPWTTATGLVPKGYDSRIDGSVQPYGLVIPETYDPKKKTRLDAWFHGRGEKLTELAFLQQRRTSKGEFTPPDAIVLHLYGRYCNANKFAGEIDLFEALDSVRRQYNIDEDRIIIRGFSMGGAACWQFAVHYPDLWCAAAPGAGFSETPDFLKVFQNETLKPTAWEQTLWHLYDCTDYAANLFNLPVVAYSGELDKQKQAADMMEKAMKAEGLDLVHIIGPKTAHKYEPEAKKEIDRRIDALAAKGRDRLPKKIRFTTWTLRYNRSHWVRVLGLQEHWKRARVEAEIGEDSTLRARTENVSAISFGLHDAPVRLDGQDFPLPNPGNQRFEKRNGQWRVADEEKGLRKKPGLQGPIDDAFMERFVIVRPTGTAKNPQVQGWFEKEMKRAIEHWRKQFRGDALVIDDTAVTDAITKDANLVLWGDPTSNAYLARIADRLPSLPVSSETQVPIMIYPNPLFPSRYVVLNSGFTFREYDYLNNARQVPRLPDWAVVDVSTPPDSRWPGKVVAADFFDEEWRLKK